jgi:hypothetical protein
VWETSLVAERWDVVVDFEYWFEFIVIHHGFVSSLQQGAMEPVIQGDRVMVVVL